MTKTEIINEQLKRFILSIPDSLSELEIINLEQEEGLFYIFKDRIETIENEAQEHEASING